MGLSEQWVGATAKLFRDGADEQSGAIAGLKRKGRLALLNRLIGLTIPFTRRNHFEVVGLGEGYVDARISLKGNRNHFGTLYAGAMFLVAEIPGGVLALFELGQDFIPILQSLDMRYLKKARSDVTVTFRLPAEERARIRREARQRGRTEFTLEGELKDDQGETVALSTAVYQVRLKDG